jgi:predicted transport protein
MAKTSGEIEKEFIDNLKEATGKDLNEWLKDISSGGLGKRNDIINRLKNKNGFGHMNAGLLTGIYFNNGKPVYADESVLLDNQFVKVPEMRSLYDSLINSITKRYADTVIVPKKTYISITKKREYAAINIKKGELRLGLDLADMPFENLVEKSKLSGPMLRISHMITNRSVEDINEKIFRFLDAADRRVNK